MQNDWKIIFFTAVCVGFLAMRIWGWLSIPKGAKCLHLVIITSKTEHIEQLVHWNRLCIAWGFMLGKGKLLLLDLGAEEKQKQVIARIIKRHSHIAVCDLDDIGNLISNGDYNQIRIIF